MADVVHLTPEGFRAAACGQRSVPWCHTDTDKVTCARCRGTMRFTRRLIEERGGVWPVVYRERCRLHDARVALPRD